MNLMNLRVHYLNPIKMKNLALTCLFIIANQFAFASESRPMPLFDFLKQDQPIEVVLKTDLSTMIEDKMTNHDYQAGIFTFKRNGKKTEIPVKVKVRGKFRLMTCDFPPMKLKFKKAQLALMGLDTFNKFKLVTHCLDSEAAPATYLKKEYLAYKMMNQLVDHSFRTQLLKIRYVDSKGKIAPIVTTAFIIEEDEQVANRMGGEIVKAFNTSPEKVDRIQLAKIALFNYMIGNSDWDLKRSKNLKFVKMGNGKLCPIAYDFDFAGLVTPPYIKHGERVVKDIHLNEDELKSIKEKFYFEKDALLQIIKNFKYSTASEKREMRKYIKTSFEKLDNVEAILKEQSALAK